MEETTPFEVLVCLYNVQCFRIDTNNNNNSNNNNNNSNSTCTLLDVGTLILLREAGGVEKAKLGVLEVANAFHFPLTPDVPCLRVAELYFILPMPQCNMYYALRFPQGIPESEISLFVAQLSLLCDLRDQATIVPRNNWTKGEYKSKHCETVLSTETLSDQQQPSTDTWLDLPIPPSSFPTEVISGQEQAVDIPDSDSISRSVTNLSKFAQGLENMGKTLVEGIYLSSGVAAAGVERERITTNTLEGEDLEVPRVISESVHTIKTISPVLVTLSRGFATALTSLAISIGKEVVLPVVEHVKKQNRSQNSQNETMADVIHLGKVSLQTSVSVWEALEAAGKMLFVTTGAASVDVVNHKFGKQAADVVADGVFVAEDAYSTWANMKGLDPRRILKKATMGTAKETLDATIDIVEQYEEKKGEVLNSENKDIGN